MEELNRDRRIYKHYYHMSFGSYMGVYVDEYLMKKVRGNSKPNEGESFRTLGE